VSIAAEGQCSNSELEPTVRTLSLEQVRHNKSHPFRVGTVRRKYFTGYVRTFFFSNLVFFIFNRVSRSNVSC
jgi:hypothetical protein